MSAARPRLVCLLPARNAAEDLPGYFESVARFADAVVALDDGSTDATGDLLRASPLVELVLSNPRRETYRGWDDAANRNRLLQAAAELDPDWLISLDADERVAPDDADALRALVDRDALRGFAYGFRVFRMTGDGTHYDQAGLWVYWLFAHAPGQRFPSRRLHFVPIPTSIPRKRWLRTTVRIQHLAGATEARRRARFEKYREADPENAFQRDYTNVLAAGGHSKPWRPRRRNEPLLVHPGESLTAEPDDRALTEPVLSAIVISRNDEDRIERAVRSVVEQRSEQPFEVIVVTSGSDRTAEIVREKFPTVKLVELARPALPGAARNAGLRLAEGDYVSFPGSHVELPQGSLAARIRAHERGYSMVTGTTLNGTPTRSGWASYFLDHSTVLPGRPSEELRAPPAHCSYAREPLAGIGGFPEDMRAGEDTVANRELFARGYTAYRARDVHLVHRSRCRHPARLASHHFTRGRAMARILIDDHAARPAPARLFTRTFVRRWLRDYVPARMALTTANVERWGGDLVPTYRRVRPLVFLGAASAWAGIWFELLRSGRAGARAGARGASATAA